MHYKNFLIVLFFDPQVRTNLRFLNVEPPSIALNHIIKLKFLLLVMVISYQISTSEFLLSEKIVNYLKLLHSC